MLVIKMHGWPKRSQKTYDVFDLNAKHWIFPSLWCLLSIKHTTRRVSTCSPAALENARPGPLAVAAWTATSPNLDIARGPQRFFLRGDFGDVPTLDWVWGKQKVHFPPPKRTCQFLSSSFMSEDLHGCAYLQTVGQNLHRKKIPKSSGGWTDSPISLASLPSSSRPWSA